MLSRRFRNDNIATWDMSDLQKSYKDMLINKIKDGTYKLETVNRCVCGSDSCEILCEKDRFGLGFGAKLCMGCGLVYTSPRLENSSLKDFYSNIYWGLTTGNKAYQTSASSAMERLGFIKQCFTKEGGVVVEIGCGTGENLYNIREELQNSGRHIEVYGCDYSEECIKISEVKFGIKVFRGNAKVIADIGIKADLIIMSHVFEHFSDLKKEMEIVGSLMNEGGILYIEVPGILDLKNKPEYKCDFINYLTLAHNYSFCLGSLKNMMMLFGFEMIRGNEYVRSVFKRSTEIHNNVILGNYSKQVYDYLFDLEKNRHFYNNILIYKRIFNDASIIAFGEYYVVYGTGGGSEYVTKLIQSLGANILFYSDSDNNKWGKTFKGKTVIPPHEISEFTGQFHKIIIASMYVDEIKLVIRESGFDIENDVMTSDMKMIKKLFKERNYYID